MFSDVAMWTMAVESRDDQLLIGGCLVYVFVNVESFIKMGTDLHELSEHLSQQAKAGGP